MSNVLMDISLHADTQHRAVLSVYTRNYQHIKTYCIWSNLSVKCLEKIVGSFPQSDASDGTAQAASLFLFLYSILCPQWSASKRYRRCSRGCRWLFTFLLCNQEHGVNNERSQSIQSVLHSKRTHRMWPHQKTVVREKRKKKSVSRAQRTAGCPV